MDTTRKAVVAVALAEYRRSKIGLPAPTPRHRAVHERYSSSKDEPGQVTVAVRCGELPVISLRSWVRVT
ncbi:unnamed protein product [Boreogadus saida]